MPEKPPRGKKRERQRAKVQWNQRKRCDFGRSRRVNLMRREKWIWEMQKEKNDEY
jgi:hypothetical protein